MGGFPSSLPPAPYQTIMSGKKGVPSVYLQRLHKKIKTEYIEELKARDLVDYEVTRDPRRIIRLPGTIHHKEGRAKLSAMKSLMTHHLTPMVV